MAAYHKEILLLFRSFVIQERTVWPADQKCSMQTQHYAMVVCANEAESDCVPENQYGQICLAISHSCTTRPLKCPTRLSAESKRASVENASQGTQNGSLRNATSSDDTIITK